MQFIQLTDEAGREVWVNLEAVAKVLRVMCETEPPAYEIYFESGTAPVRISDPAEVERLRGILSFIVGDPAAKVKRFRALKSTEKAEETEKENPFPPTIIPIFQAIQDEGIMGPGDEELSWIDFSTLTRPAPHDWRKYIPQVMADAWPRLSTEVRWTAYLFAERQAQSENWE